MTCPECERLKNDVLDANLDYINANSELMRLTSRATIHDDDAEEYKAITARLAETRKRAESIHHQFVRHKISAHGEDAFATGR
jgi:hypothetical protein